MVAREMKTCRSMVQSFNHMGCITSGDLMHNMATIGNNTVLHLKLTKRADLKFSHHKENVVIM